MDISQNRILDITRYRWVRSALINRWPQFLVRAITLGGFIFTILVGLMGSQVGSHNFALLFVWIAWWTALKLLFIPLGGRAWCSVCPIPMPGEWLQQRSILYPGLQKLGLNRRWPKNLRNTWLQIGGFLAMGLFSVVILTQPNVTAWSLLVLILIAIALSLVFERRAFCQYLCPVGGFVGCYSQLAPLEVRVKDDATCAKHIQKTCYVGCEKGIGCPWLIQPWSLQTNQKCGLCMECLRTCPKDNIAVNLRSFGSDLSKSVVGKMDETIMGLVLMGSVLFYSALYLGNWGGLRLAAFSIGSFEWLMYVLAFLGVNLIVLPGTFSAAVWIGQRLGGGTHSLPDALISTGRTLLPLGFSAWLAFTISFALAKFAYIWPVLSDPFGWGWDLFGTASAIWKPYLPGLSPFLMVILLLGGLLWSSLLLVKAAKVSAHGKRTIWQVLPLKIFALLFTLGMMLVLIG
jgi:hypothetical protein